MTLLLMTCLQELFFRPVSSDALLQTHFFRRILPDAFKLQIKFLCSWTCSIRIFMNSTLIMDHVHLNKLFSISNWWFLIPCYYQNLRGDFEKHPLFQHTSPPKLTPKDPWKYRYLSLKFSLFHICCTSRSRHMISPKTLWVF